MVLAFGWWRRETRFRLHLIAFALLGFVLASQQPALWVVIVFALGSVGLLAQKNRFRSLLPAFVVAAAGLPFLLYLKFILYAKPPYNMVTLWEPAMRVEITLWDFIKLNGPVMIVAILGLPFLIRSMTRERFTVIFMTAVSLFLYFSHIPDRLSILNIRFLSPINTLCYAAVAGLVIEKLRSRFPKFRMSFLMGAVLLIALAIPLDAQQLLERNYLFAPNNAWDYLSPDVLRAYDAAKKIARPDDVFLVFYPFDASFVGLTGKRLYTSYSNPLWRFRFDEKQKILDRLFSDSAPESEKRALMRETHITYLLNYSWITPPFPGFTKVYANDLMTMYKVPVP